ncbi:MAG TPA: serine/threonine-protein kinase [Thermoguttaceae bacterium]|nr:serine/threonine-protein kinase [Thermoguttaceae bacterium]
MTGTPENENQDALNLLDDYLVRLQAGQSPDRAALLEKCPELASALDCLDALEALAPPPPPDDTGGDHDTLDVEPALGDLPRPFGQYELLSEIGRGGMGVVYKARQKALDRTVAIKMILASHLASPEHVRRFHVEAKAAARMQHSNIVHIHEVGQLHGHYYFAMEYVEGNSLAQRIAQSQLDVDMAVRLVAAIARAVDHLHQHNIIHRDLKPSNILLDAEEHPYLTDFGLAKVFEPGSETTATGVIAGTPSYMAPEQAAGQSGKVGPAADIYSLGAILYELLTGRPPFREENPLDTLMQVISREPNLPRQWNPKIPRGLELICLKCLAKSPGDRYASAAAVADDLERFARGEALEVRPPNLGQRLWSWTRRQPALALRLGALVLLYIVATTNSLLGLVDWRFYGEITILLAVWAGISLICQQFLDSRRWSIPARFVWGTLDSILLLAVLLFLADGAASPLVVGYPLLIAGSGLWFRVRFVSLMTGLSLVSYGIVVADFYLRRIELHERFDTNPDRHIVFCVALIVLGGTVAYLVHRVRTLSSFYGRQAP